LLASTGKADRAPWMISLRKNLLPRLVMPTRHRGAAGTAHAGMTRRSDQMRRTTTAEVRPMRAEQHVSARRPGELATLITCVHAGT
jgi:hypothetical protein